MEETLLEAHLRLTGLVAKGAALEEVLDTAMRFCETRSPEMLCSILLLNQDGRTLRHGAAPSLPKAYLDAIDGAAIGPKAGSCGTAAFLGKPVIVEDILIDPLWADYRSLAAPHGLRACWSTPISDSAGKLLGTFAIYYRRPGMPSEEHMRLIRIITHISGIAISACKAEREKRLVFERISDAFIALDKQWRYTFINAKAAAMFGSTPAKLIGKNIWEEFPEGRGQKFHLAYERAMAEQVFVSLEEFYPPYGKWFENRIYPSPDGITIYFHDVSERKRDEERLRQAEKLTAIGQLAGGVAHDFNNQLSVILGYAGLLENRLADPETKRFATAILRAANRSGDLTRNLLAFSRQGHYENVPVDFHELISEICELLGHSLEKQIELVRDFRAARSIIIGDPATLQNALLNLALNARDAMPGGGTLAFRTETVDLPQAGAGTANLPAWREEMSGLPAGSYLHMAVADTGTGMSDEVRRRVFEPFFTTKPVGKGTGLGLASVFGTVKSHRGRVAVETTAGLGTAFHLFMPLSALPVMEEKPSPPASAGKGLRVLVVDDDAPVREIMRDMLRAGGHEVLEASGGRAAMEIFGGHWREIDLVILDLMMADMDGSATYAALRKVNPAARVLLSTGYPGDAKIPALMDAGIKGLLQKPYEKTHLDKMIAAALA